MLKRERTNHQRPELNGDITTRPTANKMISKYYQQLYVQKFNNLEEMNQFLEAQNAPKNNQDGGHNLKSYKPL